MLLAQVKLPELACLIWLVIATCPCWTACLRLVRLVHAHQDEHSNTPHPLSPSPEQVYKQMLNRAKCVYTSQEALVWMVDVANGMQYLHQVTDSKPMIIHRDLKVRTSMHSLHTD